MNSLRNRVFVNRGKGLNHDVWREIRREKEVLMGPTVLIENASSEQLGETLTVNPAKIVG